MGIFTQVYRTILAFPCIDAQSQFFDALIWPIMVNILTTYGTAPVEQGFICYLFYALTKRRFTTGFLVSSIFVHFAFAISSTVLAIGSHNSGGMAALHTLY
ncbi:hypothetical protein C8R44DRAFT_772544 [Mycena epipterygia]|nr:hypothetical protein C8R44DRAFT_772544 [Mycena epipterygia]